MKTKILGFVIFLFIQHNVLAQVAASDNYITQTGTLGSTYDWVDCSGGTSVFESGDDEQKTIAWPFNFSFYDNNYTTSDSFSVSTNGFIRLDGTASTNYTTANNYDLTSTATQFGQIIGLAIYDGNTSDNGSWIRYLVSGSAPNRILTIEYNQLEIDYNDRKYADVQVSIYESTNRIILKLGVENINKSGVDIGLHSGVDTFFNKWQEVNSGTNSTWIEYTPPNVEVNATTGTSQAYYATVKEAYDKINDGTHQGVITVKVHHNTTETTSAKLNTSGSGSANYTSINMYPTKTGLSITGNIPAPLIDLNGADNVIINGSVNGSGATKDLSIINTSTASSGGNSTIRFINGATTNTVKYCTIKGSETRSTYGVIFFSTSNTSLGNSNNIIDNNNITNAGARPVNAIYSAGTGGKENTGNVISNSNIYNFLKHATASRGIRLDGNTNAWTINGNSFYETTSFVPTGAVTYEVIRISNESGNEFVISNNYIGGSEPQCGGTAWTKTNNNKNYFNAIYLNLGTTLASSLQNNTIQNFNWSNSVSSGWSAINVIAGNVNIGTVTGNTIGSTTGINSISVTGGSNGQSVFAIKTAGTGTINCNNNSIGSITGITASTFATHIYGIYLNGSTVANIENNSIGSSLTANSIFASSASTGNLQKVYGIYSANTGTSVIHENTISNLNNNTSNTATSTSGHISGIYTLAGTNTITKNTVSNLSIANASTRNSPPSISGIYLKTTTEAQSIKNNNIFNLSNTYNSFEGNVIGIFTENSVGASTGDISANFIHSLSVGGGTTGAKIYGIYENTDGIVYSNNIITLGGDASTEFFGLYDVGNSGKTLSLFFNSIYISGTNSGTEKSYCLRYNTANNTRDLRNNILFNARSGGTGGHYAIYYDNTDGTFTSDYNDYFVSGTGGVVAYYNGDKTTLADLQTSNSRDAASLNTNPDFTSAGGTNVEDYITSAIISGIIGTGITTDYEEITRNNPPKIGALESSESFVWQGNTDTDYGTATNWKNGAVPPNGAEISFAVSPNNNCVLDINRTLKSITNAQSLRTFVINGKQLTITGDLVFSNGAQINASAASSEIIFEGLAAQSIPNGAFINNIISVLTLNNDHGLTQNGAIIVEELLTLTNGDFTIGTNTLTLNGAITTTSGSLIGGSTSNISIGGSGVNTTLPSVTVDNFTLNRLNGISLGGDLTIEGALALTTGTLVLGSNTITITNNVPTRTNGNIDASNSSATVNFLNPIGIILPTSLFSGSINNLTVNGGGITVDDNIAVNGVLDLQTANPSAIKGLLDITDTFELSMGEIATTIGAGDLTGIVKRQHTFTGNIAYTFGNQYTSITFVNVTGGIKPIWISCKITIGAAPSWRTEAINRTYSFAQDGTGTDRTITNLHYLDTELHDSETDEDKLVFWDAYTGSTFTNKFPRSKSNNDGINNWVGLTGMAINFIATSSSLDVKQWGLSYTNIPVITWTGNGSPTYAGDWSLPGNWNGGVPTSTDNVLIPSILPSDTNGYPTQNVFIPIVPAVAKTIEIELGASITVDNYDITVYGDVGAWNNSGAFTPGSGTVLFANGDVNNTVSINGTTYFNNLTINENTYIQPATSTIIGISGALTAGIGSVLDFTASNNTIEYNGIDQTVINPIGPGTDKGYHNLLLSGSGTKIMPITALNIEGDFILTGALTTTAQSAITIGNKLQIIKDATFESGLFDHIIGGDLDLGEALETGTFIASTETTITLNSTVEQKIYGKNSIIFENLVINNSTGVEVFTDLIVNNELTLTNGNLNIGETTLTIKGDLTKSSGYLKTDPLSSLTFEGTTALTLSANLFFKTPVVNNLTINRTAGVVIDSDLTVNGILNLQSTNPSSGIIGTLDMGVNMITMGENTTTIGDGDITGIVKREHLFNSNTEYTFGNQYTTINFIDENLKPTWISIKITIGTVPSWSSWTPSGKVNREYQIARSNNTSTSQAIINMHYLPSELDATFNNESLLTFWHKFTTYESGLTHEHGKSDQNLTNHFLQLSGITLGTSASTNLEDSHIAMAYSLTTKNTWKGEVVGFETEWEQTQNWTAGHIPLSTEEVLIPDGLTNYPSLTATANAVASTIEIKSGASITANSYNLTVSGAGGAWDNNGSFNPGTGKVVFDHGTLVEIVTVAGVTDFYNIEVGANTTLRPSTTNILRIAGTGSADITSIIDFSSFENTVEWNGTGANQTIVNPNGIGENGGYYNLILSGSGSKTLQNSVLKISGNFTTSGTTTTVAADSLKVTKNISIGIGSTFDTGVFHHEVAGNFENNGTFTGTSGGTIIFNGEESQTILGTSTTNFDNLTLDKTLENVTISTNINVNNNLLLSAGNLIIENNILGINGTISNPSGAIEVTTNSNISFGGTSELTINNDLFSSTPSINNLSINRSGGVIFGNQNITVNGLLDLSEGILTIAENTLILTGDSPTRTIGNIDVSNPAATIEFSNSSNITLPSTIFINNINNFTASGTGGVIINEDITLIGILNLQGGNPSLTKGCLDISPPFIIEMGADATTIGDGDVTGIVKREHTFENDTDYSFGSQYTTLNFLNVTGGIKPTWVKCKLTLGTVPTWRSEAINRNYSFAQSAGTDRMIVKLHYLDNELHGTEIDETKLVYWDAYNPDLVTPNSFTKFYPRNKNGNDTNNNWVQLTGPAINYIATSDILDVKQWGLSYTDVTTHTWTGNGSPTYDGDWSLPGNWNGGVPQAGNDIQIPAPATLPTDNNGDLNPYTNLLPIIAPSEVNSIEIVSGATLSATDYDITVYGSTNAWVNNGTFIPGTSNVIFANGDVDNITTIDGITNFYDITIDDKTQIQPTNGSVIGIENEIYFVDGSILDFNTTNNTIDYNGGDQTIIEPNVDNFLGYYNLSLSGDGVKTLPSTMLELIGSLSIYESAIVTADNNISVNANLNITDTSKLTISPSIELTVTGTISNLVGNSGLILSSSNIGTASLSHNTDNVPATVERYISGVEEDWHFLSSPITNQTITGSNWLPNGTYGNGTGYDLYIWDEPTPCWIYQLNTSIAPNWPTKHPSSTLIPGRGYLYSVQELNPTNEFIGNLNNGTITYPLTADNTEDLLLTGFNLIGNPYPSAIDWKASTGWTRSNLLDSGGGYDMWIWNPTANNYGVFNSLGTTGTNDVAQYIPSMQGFFVRADTNADIVMTNDIRSHTGKNYWMKSGKVQVEKSNLKVKIQSNSGFGYDEVLFQFGYSTNSAGATKLFSPKKTAPSTYTTLENKKLSVKYLNDTINNPFVPVNFKPGNNGTYKFIIDIKGGNFNHLILEDKITKVFHDLLNEPEYIFKSSVKDNTDRFIVHFKEEHSIIKNDNLPINIYYDGEYIVVDLSLISNDTEVVIFDLLGKRILNKNLEGKTIHRISINSQNGVYIMVAKNLNKIMRKKLIVH